MKSLTAAFILILPAFFACHSSHPKMAATTTNDTSHFFPTADFFKEQIKYVDLRNFPIYRVVIHDGKKDSAAISKETFITIASPFLKIDMGDPKNHDQFKESVFNDLSTESLTLTYVPVNPSNRIQQVDVLLNDATHQVKRIFAKSVYTTGDTTVTEMISWKADKSFHLNRFATNNKGFTSSELNFVNWNDKP